MFSLADGTTAHRSLLVDLRSGDAGCLRRVAMSIAAAAGLVAATMGTFGLLAQFLDGFHGSDQLIFASIIVMLAFWFFALSRIWRGYRRRRRFLKTLFGVLAIGAVTVPTCTLIDISLYRGEEFLIAATILSAITGMVVLITTTWYKHAAGEPVMTSEGNVNVRCPECDYSMIGLHESRCPECGAQYTLDELIRRQEYGAVRESTSPPLPQSIAAGK